MNKTLYEIVCEDMKLKPIMQLTPYFKIDNVIRYVLDNPMQFTDNTTVPNIVPPFDAFAMEYTIPEDHDSDRAIIETFGGSTVLVIILSKELEEYRNEVVQCDFHVFLDAPIKMGTARLFVDRSGAIVPVGSFTTGYAVMPASRIDLAKIGFIRWNEDQVHEVIGDFILPCSAAMAFLNCRNVEQIEYPMKRTRVRRRDNKPEPEITYKVLKINAMGGKRYTGSTGGTGKGKAFHIARGHFKTFTEDAPLFGKWTGTYWWAQQVRGRKKHGEVIKEYEVTI